MRKELKLLLSVLLISGISYSSSTKAINYMELDVIRSGELVPTGHISSLDVYLYVPQKYVYLDANAQWSIVKDKYGNKMVRLHWDDVDDKISYQVVARVRNVAHSIDEPTKFSVGNLVETPLIKVNDDMVKFSYGKNSLDGFLKLFRFVSSFSYDTELSDIQMPADWVFENKRGTCDEFSNCLAALSELAGIKTRVVVGYAYRSPKDKRLGNHAWVQVHTDKGWLDADPTWRELGYIDGSHIVLAYLPDTNMTEKIKYVGSGDVEWRKNEDVFKIINVSYSEPIKFDLEYGGGNNGYLKASLIGPCYMADLKALSCVDGDKMVLDIKDDSRLVWFCGNTTVFWAYTSSGFSGVCPVKIYDQSGVSSIVNVESGKTEGNVRIDGPDTVSIGEEFTLSVATDRDFVLFSPNFTLPISKKLRIKIHDPGIYKFYAFDGRLYEKDVSVVREKSFDVDVTAPQTVKGRFNVTVYIKPLKDTYAIMEISYGNQKYTEKLHLIGDYVVSKEFDAESSGPIRVVVSDGDVVIKTVYVEAEKSIIEKLLEFVDKLLTYFSDSIF